MTRTLIFPCIIDFAYLYIIFNVLNVERWTATRTIYFYPFVLYLNWYVSLSRLPHYPNPKATLDPSAARYLIAWSTFHPFSFVT
jgi:hypothetical protein